MSPHTPGPWAIDPGSNGQDLLAVTPNEGKPWTVRAWIADVRWKDNWLANMSLITTAPDLLATLKDVEWGADWSDGEGGSESACPLCGCTKSDGHSDECRLAAVIAKAEGRP